MTTSPAPAAAQKRMKTVEGKLVRGGDSEKLQDLLTSNEMANILCEDELSPIFLNSCITTQDLFHFRQVNRSWRDAATAILLQRNACQVVLKELALPGPTNKIENENKGCDSGDDDGKDEDDHDDDDEDEDDHDDDVEDEDDETDFFDPLLGFRNGRGNKKALVEELAELISTSPKFPASTLLLKLRESECADERIPPSFKASLESLKPHGEMFLTLCLDGLISKKKFLTVLTIVCSFTPKLKYLDLEQMYLQILPYEDLDDDEIELDLNTSVVPTLPITKIRLGRRMDTVYKDYQANREFMAELLKSAPALKSIENVNKLNIPGVNWGRKNALVRDLKIDCDLNYDQQMDVSQFAWVVSPIRPNHNNEDSFSTDSGLSHLTLDLSTPVYDFRDVYPRTRTALNKLIDSVSHTLEHLRIIVDPTDICATIQIPPMKKLKSLELTQDSRYVDEDDEDQMYRGREGESSAYLGVFQEQGLTREEYFPCLKHIKLGVSRQDIYGTLIKFFNMDVDERFAAMDYRDEDSSLAMEEYMDSEDTDESLDEDESVGDPHEAVEGDGDGDAKEAVDDDGGADEDMDDDCLCGVQVLEISGSVWPKQIHYTPMSSLFPNIRVFKIQYRSYHGLRNCVWDMCPNAESVEIYNVYHKERSIDFVDRFFTGFPLDSCAKLRRTELPSDSERNAVNCFELIRFFSCILGLPRLKEFKMKFRAMLSQFGSQVSGLYAFQKMPQTKVTFSFPKTLENRDDIEVFMAPLAPYAHVIFE